MKKQTFLLPLNIDNLINFLAAGLITSKNNFPIGNYMPDSLQLFPDHITLYKSKVPHAAIAMTKEYDKNLFECIVTITLKVEESLCEEISQESPFQIATSIPTSSIFEITFESSKAKDKFIRAVKNSNVISSEVVNRNLTGDASLYKKLFKVSKKSAPPVKEKDLLFEQTCEMESELPQTIEEVEESNTPKAESNSVSMISTINYPKVSAYGAVIALLFAMSKNGQISNELFNSFINGKLTTSSDIDLSKDFIRVFDYFNCNNEEFIDPEFEPFFKILDIIINNNKSSMLDSLILHLQSPASAKVERFQSFFAGIGKQMQDIYQSSEERTTRQLVKDLSQNFDKTNIKLYFSFFAIKSDIETLLNTQVEGLREQDYLMLAIFYGMRDGYEGLPKFIREYEGIEDFSSYKMAQYASLQLNANFEFDEIIKPPTLLYLLDSTKLNTECKQSILLKLKLEESASIELKTKDFNYVNGAMSIPLTAKPKFTLKIDEEKFTELMLKIAPSAFNYQEVIKLASK
jgi:hypothetical protein